MAWSLRIMSSRTLVGCGIDAMYWVPLLKFGLGNVPAFSWSTAFWSIRLAGMTLPGKCSPGVNPSATYCASLAGSLVFGTHGACTPGLQTVFLAASLEG